MRIKPTKRTTLLLVVHKEHTRAIDKIMRMDARGESLEDVAIALLSIGIEREQEDGGNEDLDHYLECGRRAAAKRLAKKIAARKPKADET